MEFNIDPDVTVEEPVDLKLVSRGEFIELRDEVFQLGRYLCGTNNELGLLIRRVEALEVLLGLRNAKASTKKTTED